MKRLKRLFKKKDSKPGPSYKETFIVEAAVLSTELPEEPSTATPTPAITETGNDPYHDANQSREEGNKYFKAGRFSDAIKSYTEGIRIAPNSVNYGNRAAAYMALRQFTPASEDCQHAISMQTSSSPDLKLLVRLARCQLALALPAEALSTLDRVIALDQGTTDALKLYKIGSEVEQHLQSYQSAMETNALGAASNSLDKCCTGIDSVKGIIPEQWWIWKVQLRLATGNLDEAVLVASDAIKVHPQSPDILSTQGLVLFLTGQLNPAIQQTTKAQQLSSTFTPQYDRLWRLQERIEITKKKKEEGDAALVEGRHAAAVSCYTEALLQIGEDPSECRGGHARAIVLSGRGMAFSKLGRYDEALIDANDSIGLFPGYRKALCVRADVHLRLKNYESAIVDYKAAISQARTARDNADIKLLQGELKRAELALKQSKKKDYYKILGVNRGSTKADIKKAFHRESRKHHPDKGGKAEHFRLVVEANEVLSDQQKRAKHDSAAARPDYPTSSSYGQRIYSPGEPGHPALRPTSVAFAKKYGVYEEFGRMQANRVIWD